jgi:hypothetical protein
VRRRPRLRKVLKWCGTATCVLILVVVAVTHRWYIYYADAYDDRRDSWGLQVTVACGSVYVWCTYGTPCVHPNWHTSRGRALQAKRFPLRQIYGDRWQRRLVLWFYLDGPRLLSIPGLSVVGVRVPLWPFFLLTFIPTAYLWYRDRRTIPPGHCPKCGYDLTANESGACPECGTKVPKELQVSEGA